MSPPPLDLHLLEVGPWPMNAYLVADPASRAALLVDPGAEPDKLLAAIRAYDLAGIFITHGHDDHVGALAEVRAATGVPVYLHPAEANLFGLEFDHPLQDELEIPLGRHRLRVAHTPGHTPGMCCLILGANRVLAGDSIFVGGPGRTWSADDFQQTMQTMQSVIFRWPDETRFYPGHGPSGLIGTERPAFESFVRRGWPADLHGDVTWVINNAG